MRITCPKCGFRDIRRSTSSGFFDDIWKAFGLVAFRCRSCRARFFRQPAKRFRLRVRATEQAAS